MNILIAEVTLVNTFSLHTFLPSIVRFEIIDMKKCAAILLNIHA